MFAHTHPTVTAAAKTQGKEETSFIALAVTRERAHPAPALFETLRLL